jgi:nicotinate-nucleotide--dimethylbenzimidazole phosphoribosyltransferase
MTDPDLEARIRARIDGKTKPPGSLGRIEYLAARIARLQGTVAPTMRTCELTIFAADHGIAAEGVSAYPQEVTGQMLGNFLAGGAASTVFAATLGIPVRVVDAGIAVDPPLVPRLLSRRIGPGTANFLREPAMTRSQLRHALQLGEALGADSDADAVVYGEMGIANTSSAALIAHRLTGLDLATLTGRGTGLDDDGLARKRAVLTAASARVPGGLNAKEALCQFGGFEIAMMAGAMIGAAKALRLILVDGFIATAAALAAAALSPGCRDAMVFAHVSAEAGHRPLLDHMGAEPLLSLGMRLGEGTGALMAWPMVRAAVAMLNDMASFDDAGVSGPA